MSRLMKRSMFLNAWIKSKEFDLSDSSSFFSGEIVKGSIFKSQ